MRNHGGSMRTVIFFLLAAPVIGYTVYFGYRKSTESEKRAAECQRTCSEEGYLGHEFRWNVFSGPDCTCFSPNTP